LDGTSELGLVVGATSAVVVSDLVGLGVGVTADADGASTATISRVRASGRDYESIGASATRGGHLVLTDATLGAPLGAEGGWLRAARVSVTAPPPAMPDKGAEAMFTACSEVEISDSSFSAVSIDADLGSHVRLSSVTIDRVQILRSIVGQGMAAHATNSGYVELDGFLLSHSSFGAYAETGGRIALRRGRISDGVVGVRLEGMPCDFRGVTDDVLYRDNSSMNLLCGPPLPSALLPCKAAP
jgi:hypothetical protein